MDNERRRANAFYALQCYCSHKGEDIDPAQGFGREEQITDLIADLLHLAAYEQAADPEAITSMALMHQEAEATA